MTHRRSQRLTVRAIYGRLTLLRVDWPARRTSRGHRSPRAHVRVCRMGWDEGLSLGGHRSEDAFLLKALAIGATSIFGGVEAGATDL